VDSALNRFEEARSVYAESLESRRLIAATGETPQSLRDLSVSLNKAGDVNSALNCFEEARTAYAESLAIMTKLAKDFPMVEDYRKALKDTKARIEGLPQPS